jgi:hypothetical protein
VAAKRSSRRTSRQKRDALAEWSRQLAAFRTEVGFDLSEPVGFSEYLLAAYGKKGTDETEKFVSQSHGLELAPGTWKQRVDATFDALTRGFAPDGMVVARGLHGLGFVPGDNIAQMVYAGRDTKEYDRRHRISYYSMNVPVAVSQFATLHTQRPDSDYTLLDVTDMWIRAAEHARPGVKDIFDAQEQLNEEFRKRTAHLDGDDDEEYAIFERERGELGRRTSKMPRDVRVALHLTQCPVVIVARPSRTDLLSFGGDSESGDTSEAEVYVKHCEPRCVEHFFVAATYKLGTPVSAALRRRYALDEHIEIAGRKDPTWGGTPKLTLHPDTPVNGGKRVRNLPSEWTWYEVPAR